jgi:hypothetical protein
LKIQRRIRFDEEPRPTELLLEPDGVGGMFTIKASYFNKEAVPLKMKTCLYKLKKPRRR